MHQWSKCLAKLFPEEWLKTAPPSFDRTTEFIYTWPEDPELDSEDEEFRPMDGDIRYGSKPGETIRYMQIPRKVR